MRKCLAVLLVASLLGCDSQPWLARVALTSAVVSVPASKTAVRPSDPVPPPPPAAAGAALDPPASLVFLPGSQAGTNKVDGLELPADMLVSADEGYVDVVAKADGPVRWLVIGTAKIKYTPYPYTVTVAVPAAGNTVFVYAVSATSAGKLTQFARTVIQVKEGDNPGPAPRPGPSPGPVNPPAPGPVVPPTDKLLPAGTALNVSIIEDKSARTPALGKLLDSATLRQKLTALGHIPRFYATTDPAVAALKLNAFLPQAGGLPAMIVQTADGVVHLVTRLPLNEDDIVATVKKLVAN